VQDLSIERGQPEMIKTYLQIIKQFSLDARLYLATNTLVTISYVGIYVMLFNLYLLRLGYELEFIGLVNAVAQLGVVFFSLPAGMLGHRWGSRRILILGLSVAAAGLGLVPLAEFVPIGWQAGWLGVTYVVAWLGGAAYMVNSLPFIMNVTESSERVHVFSVREALGPLALFAGNLIGGLLPGLLAAQGDGALADPAPYRYALFIAAALFSLAPLTMLASSKADQIQPDETSSQPLTTPTSAADQSAPIGLIVFLAVVMLLQLAGKSVTDTFFTVYLDVSLQLSPAWIGTLSAVAQLLVIPVALFAPSLLARWGKGRTIIGGTLGMAGSLLLLAVLPQWSMALR
jgi:MFS family permease